MTNLPVLLLRELLDLVPIAIRHQVSPELLIVDKAISFLCLNEQLILRRDVFLLFLESLRYF